MGTRNIEKENLYESVKQLLECEIPHVHLPQQKLFTLFSIAFQYMLYRSSNEPGAYILRVEDSYLAEKLARKAKDETSRKFMARLLHTRKLRFERSSFYLDYFNLQSWSLTADIPREKVKAALIVKNTSHNPLIDETDFRYQTQSDMQVTDIQVPEEAVEEPVEAPIPFAVKEFGPHYYLETLKSFVPNTITIAYGENFDGVEPVKFGFIPEPQETLHGVKIARDVQLTDSEDED
ncbi:MAG: hypothetical protein H6621_01185 [Halobacteriovoraceae bacterium]|nr:hypothetical protein [Halobacteriovoraceae bacterium]MCB9093656.1 hypothetical protein [Halobacteriovoraceae bacterium]